MIRKLVLGTLSASLLIATPSVAETFDPGTIIIPMDTTFQDSGMLKAYGLVYELLRNGVPVEWAIRKGKDYGGADFTASATPYPSGATVTAHGYRGGPWLVGSSNADVALPIIAAWKSKNTTTVHIATTSFDVDIARELVVAPTIAMLADGNQKIARKYMQAAGIPDSTLNYAWPDTSPDMLDPTEVAGPSTSNHHDGKLFDGNGDPVYCQLMSMHWGVTDARAKPEVVAEVRSFLGHPTHFFAECQAVNAFENDTTNGLFLTHKGFVIGSKPSAVDFYNADYPFAQLDGPFQPTGGSEPSYTLAKGDAYKDADIVMLTTKGTPVGTGDVWMTGYLDGACAISGDVEGTNDGCSGIGKVSYLGGHEYDVAVPISTNPDTQGTRLFLNSLFEAPCATREGQPVVSLSKDVTPTTTTSELTFTLSYVNEGPTTVLAAILRDAVPAGATFVSATGGGKLANGVVSWNLGNLGDDETGSVSFTVNLSGHGTYANQAFLDYKVGLNAFTKASNTTSTIFDYDADGDGVVDTLDTCPDDYNPAQELNRDVLSCGACGNVCNVANGTPRCSSGTCRISVCATGFTDCDRQYANGCEVENAHFADDANNCGACGKSCSALHSTSACVASACTISGCESGFADCNQVAADGCEYATAGFQSDRNHCGNCTTQCAADQVCVGGSCVTSSCPTGKADCAGPAGNDCETSILTSASNCGGCGVTCAPFNATGSCVAGVCTVGGCTAGHSDCNGLAGDGCEYDNALLGSDPANCGACGRACAPANGSGTCAGGVCTITGCASGHSDCNETSADGCEYDDADFQTDAANCGACGNVCAPAHAAGQCLGGSCHIGSCDPGHVDLDGNAANGCELTCSVTGVPETQCNGVDDDCDGTADEDYQPSTCGTGACAAASTCVLGVEHCAPAVGTTEGPVDMPNCSDGADNDCDGAIDADDEDCDGAPGGGAGGAGSDGGASSGGTQATGGSGTGSRGGTGGGSTSTSGGAGSTSEQGGSPTTGGDGGEPGAAGESSTTGGGGTGTGGKGSGGNGTGASGSVDPGASGQGSGQAGGGDGSGEKGGCACRIGTQPSSPFGAASGLFLLALAAFRRRRRQH